MKETTVTAKALPEKPTYPKSDFDKVADVVWFIKGMIAAGNDTFDSSHLRAFADIRDAMHRSYNVRDEF